MKGPPERHCAFRLDEIISERGEGGCPRREWFRCPPNETGALGAHLAWKGSGFPSFALSLPRERLHLGSPASGLAAITYSPTGHQDL